MYTFFSFTIFKRVISLEVTCIMEPLEPKGFDLSCESDIDMDDEFTGMIAKYNVITILMTI